MAKKIFTILITAFFIFGLTTVNAIKLEKRNDDKYEEKDETHYLGKAKISIGLSGFAEIYNHVSTNGFFYSGDYEAEAEIDFLTPGDSRRLEGAYQITIAGTYGPYINEHGRFDYEWLESPDDILISDIGNIPNGNNYVSFFAHINYNIWIWDGDSWVFDRNIEIEDRYEGTVSFPKTKNKIINPIFRIFENYPKIIEIINILSIRN